MEVGEALLLILGCFTQVAVLLVTLLASLLLCSKCHPIAKRRCIVVTAVLTWTTGVFSFVSPAQLVAYELYGGVRPKSALPQYVMEWVRGMELSSQGNVLVIVGICAAVTGLAFLSVDKLLKD